MDLIAESEDELNEILHNQSTDGKDSHQPTFLNDDRLLPRYFYPSLPCRATARGLPSHFLLHLLFLLIFLHRNTSSFAHSPYSLGTP